MGNFVEKQVLLVIGEPELEDEFKKIEGLFDLNFHTRDDSGLSQLQETLRKIEKDFLVVYSDDEAKENNGTRSKFQEEVPFDFEINNDVWKNPSDLVNFLMESIPKVTKFFEEIETEVSKPKEGQSNELSGIAASIIRKEMQLISDDSKNCFWKLEEYRLHLQSLLETLVEKSIFANQDDLGLGTSLFLAEYSTFLQKNREKKDSAKLEAVSKLPTYYFELDRKFIVKRNCRKLLLASFLVFLGRIKYLRKFDLKGRARTFDFFGPLKDHEKHCEELGRVFSIAGFNLTYDAKSRELSLSVPLIPTKK